MNAVTIEAHIHFCAGQVSGKFLGFKLYSHTYIHMYKHTYIHPYIHIHTYTYIHTNILCFVVQQSTERSTGRTPAVGHS